MRLTVAGVDVTPPEGMEHVGWWCDDCCGEAPMRRLNGAPAGYRDSPTRCGVDYGEGYNSHLNVRPMFVPLRLLAGGGR